MCCISSVEEAACAIAHGACALGLVSSMPSGPGVIEEALIAEIADAVPPGVATFLLTCATNPEAIIHQQRRCRTSTVQLVDAVAPADHAVLRRALPGIKLVQVVHVTGPAAVPQAATYEAVVDALLLDSGNPALATKELGGTARVHDWRLSRQIVERVACPVFLAGGLTPANVASAAAQVQPFGIDVCSGVRTDGHLDEAKLAAFVDHLWSAP